MIKRYLTKVAILFLPVLVIAVSMEILLRNIPNDYSYKKQYLDQNASQIETLILGSSHTFLGLMPIYFDGHVFNAANPAQSLDYDFMILKKYQNNFKNLKTIILPISYPSFWLRIDSRENRSHLIKNYEMYFDINSSENLSFHLEVLERPLKSNMRKAYYYFIQGYTSFNICQKFGWGRKRSLKFKDDSERYFKLSASGKRAAKEHTLDNLDSETQQNTFNESIQIVSSIINWSKKNNINVILITTPTHESYRQNLNPDQLNTTLKTAKKIASKYDNCMYINMLSDRRFLDEDFRDAHHLSIVGASKCSKIINKKISEFKRNSDLKKTTTQVPNEHKY